MVAKPLSLQGVNIPDPRKTYTLAEAVEAAVEHDKKQREKMMAEIDTDLSGTVSLNEWVKCIAGKGAEKGKKILQLYENSLVNMDATDYMS